MKSVEEELYGEIWRQKILREPDVAADGESRTNAAASRIGGGARFLDIGCGEGTLATRVRKLFTEIHGIDISEEAVQLAIRNGVRALRVNLNVDPIPFPENHFDVVTALDVIEHVFDPMRLVREIHRVLTPRGYTVISTPNIRKIQRVLTLVRGRFPRTSYDPVGYDGGHLHYFTSQDMRALLERQGFEVTLIDGICSDRRTWKYRLVVAFLGKNFEKEFLSNAILVKANKR
jgi:methionine biosynthesis protein MetW